MTLWRTKEFESRFSTNLVSFVQFDSDFSLILLIECLILEYLFYHDENFDIKNNCQHCLQFLLAYSRFSHSWGCGSPSLHRVVPSVLVFFFIFSYFECTFFARKSNLVLQSWRINYVLVTASFLYTTSALGPILRSSFYFLIWFSVNSCETNMKCSFLFCFIVTRSHFE